MSTRQITKIDEHDVEFSDTRQFSIERWEDAVRDVKETLTDADLKTVEEPRDWQAVYIFVREKGKDRSSLTKTRNFLNYLVLLPKALSALVNHFIGLIKPNEIDTTVLWGLVELNTTLCCKTAEASSRALQWSKKLRSAVDLFNKCLESCEEDDENEARLKIIEVFEAVLGIFSESIQYLRLSTDSEGAKEWPEVERLIGGYLSEIEAAGKHLKDTINFSKANLVRQVNEITYRHNPTAIPEENATFPLIWINERGRNHLFFGREAELKKINNALDHTDNKTLQTYTIYGRRGVGKTDIALEYAYSNPSNFDAIFWIRCETSITIRQSFNDMAVELILPGADRHGHHEENQLAVLKWLKETKKRWLLIFDNAEQKEILKGYWPLGAKGSILITSRNYYNFLNHAQRQGDTVKPFEPKESWDLLLRLLGPEWVQKDRDMAIPDSEYDAAKLLLGELGGLALAIQQAAQIIKNPAVGGDGTIQNTYNSFLEEKRSLPNRHGAGAIRSEIFHALDSLWSIMFKNLSKNARSLLGVLSLLSPDGILIDLFLPKNQRALDGRLEFCKQDLDSTKGDSQTLANVISIPAKLDIVIRELLEYKLISLEGRVLFCHRVVQEAMNYYDSADLQQCFDSASALVYEAFPKQVNGDYLASQWASCEEFISHGAQLSRMFTRFQSGSQKNVKGSYKFVQLLLNCSRYLYEAGDYDLCLKLTESATMACENKETLQYADICSAAGSAYYELNRLDPCRENWETYKRLQDKLLQDKHLERSASYHNMGNLEYASENQPAAMKFLSHAIEIRSKAGDQSAGLLATSYLCIARVYQAQQELEIAFKMLGKAEALFVRTIGAQAHFMAYVHYAYGNIEYEQRRWAAARRSYETSLKIALATAPIHPITIAIYYSLGCVEFARNGHSYTSGAHVQLDKALLTAQLRSPNRDDGTIARILWKKSAVLRSEPTGLYQTEASDLLIRAEMARGLLNTSGEGRTFTSVERDDDFVIVGDEEENSYDALVPGFFR